jgi:two-component system phosphate regulon response regulator PhoB
MPKTIIVIEDDPDILDMMTYILKDEGYDIISSTDCSPLKDLPASQPDLILMDNRLREGSGMDECRKLKEQDSTRHIPVVMVSANPQLPRLAAESLADGYVSKPFDLDELIAVVRQYTGT